MTRDHSVSNVLRGQPHHVFIATFRPYQRYFIASMALQDLDA